MKCTCGELTALNVVHRVDGPCYIPDLQRTWVGLTDEEMFKTWLTVPAETEDRLAFGRAIEAKLKEKNA